MLCALRSMRAVLRQDGLLVITQGMTDKLWRERPRFILEINTSEISRLFVIDYINDGARFSILDIFHSSKQKGLKVWSIDHPHILLGADHKRLLREAGFADVGLMGDYDFQDYDEATSVRLIVVARK